MGISYFDILLEKEVINFNRIGRYFCFVLTHEGVTGNNSLQVGCCFMPARIRKRTCGHLVKYLVQLAKQLVSCHPVDIEFRIVFHEPQPYLLLELLLIVLSGHFGQSHFGLQMPVILKHRLINGGVAITYCLAISSVSCRGSILLSLLPSMVFLVL